MKHYCLITILLSIILSVSPAAGMMLSYHDWTTKLKSKIIEIINNNENPDTATLWPITTGIPVLFDAITLKDKESVRNLLEHKANPNIVSPGPRQTTPLYCAISIGSVDLIQLLLDYGASINTQNNEGNSPLMHVADELYISNKARAEIARLLIDRGANKDMINNQNKRARDIAIDRNRTELVKLLDSYSPLVALENA